MNRSKLIIASLIAITLAIISITSLEIKRYNKIDSRITELETKLASTTAELSKNIKENHDELALLLNQQKRKLGDYIDEVSGVSNTVNTLQKLSKTDPELLAKYSKVYFLNENYAPTKLTGIPNQYKYNDEKMVRITEPVWPFLKDMIDAASKKADIKIYVDSGYRSFTEQTLLKNGYKVTYGAGTANQFSADQGYSEHQLGTTVDLITTGLDGQLDGFEKTKAYTWLVDNAYKYGFILSYPQNNTFYVFEPWHWRFVGVKLATYLHDQNKIFYNMDQRDIDEYLVSIFD